MAAEFKAMLDGLNTLMGSPLTIVRSCSPTLYMIYIDLLDAENHLKILKIILDKENLQSGFQFEHLSNETEGYSGSDLKNLCIATTYRPIQELLEIKMEVIPNK
ncbi:unnamed protein product [Ilex paraguariensis]|uniref:AAA ATPase AAA+ lid domain-containing protein n=1 Tax=Ilex paraguariensis TaxID=185542 RepID=A0ABC8RXE5_9AQUA